MSTIGEQYADAIARRDAEGLTALLADDVDFVGMTPGRTWPASTPQEVVDVLLGHWFEESDVIDSAVVEAGEPVVDTERVAYRFRLHNAAGPHEVEDQAYLRTADGRITWVRTICSGFRPTGVSGAGG